jgi:glucose/arabinose dehydrogenase
MILGLLADVARAQVTISDPNFVAESLHTGNGMISVDFHPTTGRIYVAEKQGRILTLAPNGSGGFNAATEFADLRAAVVPDQESGLLGLVLDPDFVNNRHIFLFYTTGNDQRVTRITANANFDQMTAGSETVILSGFPRGVTFHKAGDIQFRPGEPDNLYVAIGDDSAAQRVQNANEYHGKILRINKTNGAGLLDNPFQNGNTNAIESRVWAIGLRNPFRFVFHPAQPLTDVIYLSENGNSTDRFSWVRRGSNGAWSQAGDNGGFLNPPDANHKVMGTSPPFLVGIAIARGGAFADPANPNSDVLLISNGMARTVYRYRLTGANLDTATAIAADGGGPFISNAAGFDMAFGPDGSLYMTTTSVNESLNNQVLRRIKLIAGSPPVARITTTPSPARGDAPLTVQFNDGSTDADGQVVSWSWNFGDNTTSTQRNPSHTYQNPGVYTASLTVTDDSGLPSSTNVTVTAQHLTDLTFTGTLFDGRDLLGSMLPLVTQLRLYRADGTTPISFTGGLGPQQNGISIPAGGLINTTISVQLTEADLVVSAGEAAALRPAFHGFTVPVGANSHTEALSFHLSNTALRGRVRDTRGTPAQVDIGISRMAQGQLYEFSGARDYLPASNIPATGTRHRTTTDAFGFYYVPIRTGDGGTRFYADIVADTNPTVYLPAAFDVQVNATAATIENVTVGLQMGGASCDDVSAQPPTPQIDYMSQIQPIWDLSCNGCHNAGSGNNGGLNLQTNSYTNLLSATSLEVPGRRLVEPGDASRSFLFEKINCSSPQVGTRMRPADPMRAEEQALVFHWIQQGALEVPDINPQPDAGVPPQDSGVPPHDSGITPEDDGSVPDPSDSGVITDGGHDAGASVLVDGAVIPIPDDSGLPRNPDARVRAELRGSCSCEAARNVHSDTAASFALMMLLGAAALSRRKR